MFYVSIPIVFQKYDFGVGAQGTVLVTSVIGSIIGFALARYQDHLYDRDAARSELGRPPPESRLYMSCAGGITVPIALFWYAFTGQPSIHWIVPCIALVVFQAGLFPVYLATFTYLVRITFLSLCKER